MCSSHYNHTYSTCIHTRLHTPEIEIIVIGHGAGGYCISMPVHNVRPYVCLRDIYSAGDHSAGAYVNSQGAAYTGYRQQAPGYGFSSTCLCGKNYCQQSTSISERSRYPQQNANMTSCQQQNPPPLYQTLHMPSLQWRWCTYCTQFNSIHSVQFSSVHCYSVSLRSATFT